MNPELVFKRKCRWTISMSTPDNLNLLPKHFVVVDNRPWPSSTSCPVVPHEFGVSCLGAKISEFPILNPISINGVKDCKWTRSQEPILVILTMYDGCGDRMEESICKSCTVETCVDGYEEEEGVGDIRYTFTSEDIQRKDYSDVARIVITSSPASS